MTTKRLDIVTPLLRSDLDRYKIQLETLQQFWQIPGTFYVLIHEHEWTVADIHALCDLDARIYVKKQEPLFGYSERVADLSGWFVQQLAKLAAATFVDTPYYLCLDADTCVRQPVTWETLFDDDCARYTAILAAVGKHLQNQAASCRVLDMRVEDLQYVTEWTTKIMHTATVRALCATIAPQGVSWYQVLADAFLDKGLVWGEYLLYHAFLERTQTLLRWHSCTPDSLNAIYFWDKGHHLTARLNPEGGPFILCGSKAGVSAQFTRRWLAKLSGLSFLNDDTKS